ncbi:UDP-glucuronic acid decarboxylase family protein [Massilia sp. DWR3-1-1]|uniref:UDP-glucuronic acid decarboxylase family protein n=1 Tax=Massilia sp. DWR3-1-1 TaxID=2804559 RepID=UPI003CEC51F9
MTIKTILVTGGAGFVGSHLCRRLLDDGAAVICVDNFSTGSERNVDALRAHPAFTVLRHDVTEPLRLEVDQIYNLACPASPVHYQQDPVRTTRVSVLGALNLLELARSTGARILQASTSEVYGDPQVHPQREDYWGHVNPTGIRACYDEGKRCAESLFFDYHRQYQTDIRMIRIFNTYGPHMHPEDGRVVSNFIVSALRGEDLTVCGDGQQSRSFQYIDDLIEGMVRVMNNRDGLIGPFNIGNPVEITIAELARMVLSLLPDSASRTVAIAAVQDDPQQRCPDISRVREALGWSPKIDLVTGLSNTIAYFRHHLQAEH